MIAYCRECGYAYELSARAKKLDVKLCPACMAKAKLEKTDGAQPELQQLYRQEWNKHLAASV